MKNNKKKRPMSSFQGKTRPLSGISFQSGIGFSNALKNHNTLVEKAGKPNKVRQKSKKKKNDQFSQNLLSINNQSIVDPNTQVVQQSIVQQK